MCLNFIVCEKNLCLKHYVDKVSVGQHEKNKLLPFVMRWHVDLMKHDVQT